MIISGGENISSVEVEDCLYQHPAVAEVAVIGVPSERWGETVKALVVLRAGQAADEADLIGFCRDRLAHFKCPTSVEFRDALSPHRDRQAAEVQAAQPVLGGLREAGELSAQPGSRRTCPGSVSAATLSKRGWRSRPSGVHSVKVTSTTSSGRAQCEPLTGPASTKGDFSVLSPASVRCSSASSAFVESRTDPAGVVQLTVVVVKAHQQGPQAGLLSGRVRPSPDDQLR